MFLNDAQFHGVYRLSATIFLVASDMNIKPKSVQQERDFHIQGQLPVLQSQSTPSNYYCSSSEGWKLQIFTRLGGGEQVAFDGGGLVTMHERSWLGLFTQIFWLNRVRLLKFSIDSVLILSQVQPNACSQYHESFLKHDPGLGVCWNP